jgi:hypothetical protein
MGTQDTQSTQPTADTFEPPKYEPQYPGFRMPDEPGVGELYRLGKDNPCGAWCISDFWEGGRNRIECQLPSDHEYEYGMPHISIDNSKAWRNGIITDVWYKDNARGRQEG